MRIRVALAAANHVAALSIYLSHLCEGGILLEFIGAFDWPNLYSTVEKKREGEKGRERLENRERARGKGEASFLTKCEFPGRAAVFMHRIN